MKRKGLVVFLILAMIISSFSFANASEADDMSQSDNGITNQEESIFLDQSDDTDMTGVSEDENEATVTEVSEEPAITVASVSSGDITITAPSGNRQFAVCQMITGNYHDGILDNMVWGENAIEEAGTPVPADTVSFIASTMDIAVIESYLDSINTITNGQSFTGAPGYYYIVETTDPYEMPEGVHPYIAMLRVVDDMTIQPSATSTTASKNVFDSKNNQWTGFTTCVVGDDVTFKIEAEITDMYDAYPEYYLAFHDNMESPLTLDKDSLKVYVDGKLITSGYDVVYPTYSTPVYGVDGGYYQPLSGGGGYGGGGYGGGGGGYTPTPVTTDTFKVEFSNLKDVESVKPGSVITIEYTTTVNEDIFGLENYALNSMSIEYTESPLSNITTDSEDYIAGVCTLEIKIEKVSNEWMPVYKPEPKPQPHPDYPVPVSILDSSYDPFFSYIEPGFVPTANTDGSAHKPLGGAEFALTKDGVTYDAIQEDFAFFSFNGLDVGTYTLIETKAPAGYYCIDPLTIAISANPVLSEEMTDFNVCVESDVNFSQSNIGVFAEIIDMPGEAKEYDGTGNYGYLTVSKKVEGEGCDTNKHFTFTVTLDNDEINGSYGDMDFVDGVAIFALKDGESITAAGLPYGTAYVVTEDDYSSDGYVTTKTGDRGTIGGDVEMKASFTNTMGESTPTGDPDEDQPKAPAKEKSPATGDDANLALWFLLLAASMIAAAGAGIKMRREK